VHSSAAGERRIALLNKRLGCFHVILGGAGVAVMGGLEFQRCCKPKSRAVAISSRSGKKYISLALAGPTSWVKNQVPP
jgi:hypothetical protein